MSGIFGFDKLREQARDHASSVVDDLQEDVGKHHAPLCESPIEKLLAAALIARGWMGTDNHSATVIVDHDYELPQSGSGLATCFVKQQIPIENIGRVDFLVYAYDHYARILKAPGWRELIVECDGHDFHERTKEQAKRDKSRDRRATLAGREVMRFTGSEIWNDPWGCAGEIMDWAGSSFG